MGSKRVKVREVVHEGDNLSHVEFTETTTEVCARWRGQLTYHLVHVTDPTKTAELVQLRSKYTGTTLSPDETLVAFLKDVGTFLDQLNAKYNVLKALSYARWYVEQDYERTYPVLETRAGCEAWINTSRHDGYLCFDRFEFKKE